MQEFGKWVTATIILWLVQLCGGILTGYDQQPQMDITEIREFGCEWSGGISTTVNCTCTSSDTEMVITENSIPPYATEGIEIQRCGKVHFGKNSIRNLRSLRFIYLHDIPSLQFDESSLYWSGYLTDVEVEEIPDFGMPALKISIENSNITQISSYTFKGHLSEIRLKGVTIENLASFAFTSLKQTKVISIQDSILKNIRQQPFKRLSVETLELKNVTADTIPSRMFSNVTVYNNFLIRDCHFNTVRPGGFIIYNPRQTEVINTTIQQLDGEGFTIVTRGGVVFKNNTFINVNDGAFRAITSNRDEIIHDKYIWFDSNTFTVLTRDSLGVSGMIPKFTNLVINQKCDCKDIEHNLKNTDYYSEIKCLHDKEYVTVQNFKTYECSVIASYSTTIIIVGVVLVLLFIVSVVLFIYYKRVCLSKKYGDKRNSKKGNLSLIVPDGRTYKETELHVIVERADLLTTDL